MISVIVPVYKVEKYLNKCVDSILNQTYKDIEVILVDDGSPDNCGEICEEYAKKDDRVRVIHKKNEGLSTARNTGLIESKGEYIFFVDSDDYININILEKLLEAIENSKADFAMASDICQTESGDMISQNILENNKVYVGDEIIESFVLSLKTSAWNKLFRKDFIGDIKFPDGRIHGEDLVFITKLLTKKTKLVTVSDVGYYYIKHNNTITTSGFSKRSFDEVYCKDTSYDQLVATFPEYKEIASVWKFKSRMNIIRKLSINNIKDYSNIVLAYNEWLSANYKKIKYMLSKKERIEFEIYTKSKVLYKFLVSKI